MMKLRWSSRRCWQAQTLPYVSTANWRRSVPAVVKATSSSWQRRDSDACALDVASTPAAQVLRLCRRRYSPTRTCSAVTPTCWATPTERALERQRAISSYLTATCSAPDRASLSSPCTSRQLINVSPVNLLVYLHLICATKTGNNLKNDRKDIQIENKWTT